MRQHHSCVKAFLLSTALGGFFGLTLAPADAKNPSQDSSKRSLRFNDLYREEHLRYHNEWSLSSSGAVAVVVSRAPSMGKAWRVKGSDVWVRFAPNEPPVNLTEGKGDNTRWQDPLWSPDGTRLLMVSTRGRMYSLWMWEQSTRKLRQVLDRSLHVGTFGGDGEAYFDWLDNRHVVVMTLPPDVQPKNPGLLELAPMASAKAGWEKWLSGEPSASVLEAGKTESAAPKPIAVGPQEMRQIVRVDVTDGTLTTVLDTYRPAPYYFYKPALSPDGQFVAVPTYGSPRNDTIESLGGTLNMTLRRTDGQPLSLDTPLPGDVLPGTPVWSPDSKQFAFFASGSSREQAPKLVRVTMAEGKVEVHDTGNVIVAYMRDVQWDWTELEWTETGELVFFAGQGDEALKKYARRDWWLIPRTGALRNLTQNLTKVPVFKRLSFTGPLVGIADNRVWKLDAAKGVAQPITAPGSLQATTIVWPQTDDYAVTSGAVGVRRFLIPREARPADGAIVVFNGDRTTPVYTKVDTATGRVTPLKAPNPSASLARLAPQADVAYWTDSRFNYSTVWRTEIAQEKQSAAREVIVLNEWQDELIAPPSKTINYTSLYGDASRAWLQLPVGYKADRRYPVIVHIYPGQQARPEPTDAYNRMAAAAGYAVMYPQMGPDNGRLYGMVGRDPYFEVPNGVLPAIDKAVELGIADPDRLFAEGLSMGGFATYALVQQTPRFRAALAMVGISSWMNGSFSSRGRYGNDVAHMNVGWMNENIQQRPAAETPWSDLGLYMRNSPIFYAERINTPLMIVHSDQDDNVPMSNSEEMFSALVQLKKRASFVRYWGEGHAIDSPANVRDLWQRRLAWFDGFGDITRDARGNTVYEGNRIKSRGTGVALTPEDFQQFDLFR